MREEYRHGRRDGPLGLLHLQATTQAVAVVAGPVDPFPLSLQIVLVAYVVVEVFLKERVNEADAPKHDHDDGDDGGPVRLGARDARDAPVR